MANFEKRVGSSGVTWRVRIRRRGHPPETKSFDTREQAKAWARQVEHGMDRGNYVSSKKADRTTLKETLERYLREVTPTKKGSLQETTRIRMWMRHKLAHKFMSQIRSEDMAEYRDERKKEVSPNTVRLELMLLSAVFKKARKEWGMGTLGNPLDIEKPKPSLRPIRRIKPGSDDEKHLLDAAGKSGLVWLKPIILWQLETSMRKGETLRLDWEDVNEKLAFLRDTKNGDPRDVGLSARAIQVLNDLPGERTGRVFPISSRRLDDAWREARAEAGLPNLRFHDLRHEAISRMADRKMHVTKMARQSGHKTLQMLFRYVHHDADEIARELDQ